MMATADEREAPAHPITARQSQRLSGRRRGGASGHHQVGIHRTGDVLIEEGADIAAIAADHRAPANRTVSHGEHLDHADLRQRVQFRTTPGARHHHAEDAGLFDRRGNRWWNSAACFNLIVRCSDLLAERDRSVQNRRVVLRCSAGVCHRQPFHGVILWAK